jgi:ABC-type hemin transport system ATPase subunit
VASERTTLTMRIRRLTIERFRGIEHLQFAPGPRTLILGPNNASKSTVLEALDLLLHHGIGRPRPAPTEIDYFGRNTDMGFVIEAVIGDLSPAFTADVREHLEGWRDSQRDIIPEPNGEGVEPVVRVCARGTPDFDVVHEFAKPESEGARFGPRLRLQLGWVFDGRVRDPAQQLGFYQGGLLDRLFADADLRPAVEALKEALGEGADAVNEHAAIASVLGELSGELRRLGLLAGDETPQFEVGGVSRRELLQALRLALPAVGVRIPLSRQGRGAQRLVLVAVLLRLAQAAGRAPIGGFEEPEEALEPLRQAQLARMLRSIVDTGGQIFVVTHSPEIARVFEIDDFLLFRERTAGGDARPLREILSPPVRQAYERWVDGAVVRGLFSRIPLLVEGSGDRAVIDVFWRGLEAAGQLAPAANLGLDIVNCEGVPNLPMLAAVLNQAGKAVAAWVDQDSEQVRTIIRRLRDEGHWSALILHDPALGRQNLEEALAVGCSLPALAAGMEAIAVDRGYTWEEQRADLVSRAAGVGEDVRQRMKAAQSLPELWGLLDPDSARVLVASALAARTVAPFEMKGGRQGRLLAERIVEREGVPENFGRVLRALQEWIEGGCARGFEIAMTGA